MHLFCACLEARRRTRTPSGRCLARSLAWGDRRSAAALLCIRFSFRAKRFQQVGWQPILPFTTTVWIPVGSAREFIPAHPPKHQGRRSRDPDALPPGGGNQSLRLPVPIRSPGLPVPIRPLQNHPGVKTMPPTPGWTKTSPVDPSSALTGFRVSGRPWHLLASEQTNPSPAYPSGLAGTPLAWWWLGFRPSAGFVVSLSLLGHMKEPSVSPADRMEVETTMGGGVPAAPSPHLPTIRSPKCNCSLCNR